MPNILIAEGTPAVWQAERAGFGLPSNFSLVAAAVLILGMNSGSQERLRGAPVTSLMWRIS